MRLLILLLTFLFVSCSSILNPKKDNFTPEDKSFKFVSDYAYGGVLIDRDTMATVAHTHLGIGKTITWNDGAISRKVVSRSVKKEWDLLLVHFDKPLPEEIEIYPLARINPGETVLIKRGVGRGPMLKIAQSNAEWIALGNGGTLLWGDSGNPWFVKRGNTLYLGGLTSKGYWGEGPNLGHPNVRAWIEKNLDK